MSIQTPNTKHQTPENPQAPSLKLSDADLAIWILVLGTSLEFGAWNWELSPGGRYV
jgi:hypothetical protein